MKINIAKSAGFCFGVKRALEIALKTAAEHKNVYMLGDIVHNETVVRQIQHAGIKKIKQLTEGKNKFLLIRAHGASLRMVNKAKKCGFNIIDATCPMVKEIHSIAKDMKKRGYQVIVIGDKKHDEVAGIIGQLNSKALVLENSKQLPVRKLKQIKRAAVVVQSTQNIDNVLEIVRRLKSYIRDLQFVNTICRPTRIKQEEIKRLPLENDLVLIIGSRESANTKRLYQIAKGLNQKTFWVQSEKDLKPKWFKGVKTVGITAGASTPDTTTHAVVERIKQLK